MENLSAEFERQRRREFIRNFRASNPEMFPNGGVERLSDRAMCLARLEDLKARYSSEPCGPIGRSQSEREGVA